MGHSPAGDDPTPVSDRHRTLLEINNAIISSLTRDGLFRAVAQALHRVVPFERTAIFLHEPTRDVLRLFVLESSLSSGYFRVGLEMPSGESHVGWVFQNRRALVRRDLAEERQYEMEQRAYADGVRSYVAVPLVARGTPVGVLAVASTTPGRYADTDAGILQDVANQVALAIENMKAYEEIGALSARARQAAERYRTLLEINNAIISNLTRDGLFRAIAEALRRVVPFERSAIFLHDPDKDALRLFVLESALPAAQLVVGWEEEPERSGVGWVFRQRRALLRRDLATEREFPMEAVALADGARALAAVPLVVRGRSIGALAVSSRTPGQYAEADLAFLQEVADQVALAVDNMQAHEEAAAWSAANAALVEDLRREVAHRRRAEEMLRSVMEGTAGATGADFFRSLVRHLALGLGVRYAFVAECRDETRATVRTVAFWRGDRIGENFEYAVGATPCGRVLEGRAFHCVAGVRQEFPDDSDLAVLGAESYLGVPIFDAAGRVIGHLAVLDDRPMEEDALTLWVLATFAARAGAEMERKRTEESLRGLHQFSQEVIDGVSQGIIVYDASLRYVRFNRFMETLTGMPAREVLGRHAPDVFPFVRETGMEAMLRRALEGEVVTTPDLLVRMPNGREVWESNTYAPHRDAHGDIVGVIALVNDVTQRKHAEGALRAALSEVEELTRRLRVENVYLQEEIRQEHNFDEIVGTNPALLDVLRRIERVAPTDATVLVHGETGTGKELIARAVHSRSRRADRPLVKVNCGAIPTGLVESELFGHVKGAFTGALERRVGRFELADRGTLFLDEVSELPLETQVKLLRVLQDHEFEPVGSSHTIRVDVRIIAATNRDLEEAVRAGRFRADLFYRLNVFPIEVPPLRARRSDIPQLVAFFLARFTKRFGKRIDSISEATRELLASYPWPGNVRELMNIIERAVVLAEGPVLVLDRNLLPTPGAAGASERAAGRLATAGPQAVGGPPRGDGPVSLEEMARRHILAALEQSGWVIEGPHGAARILDLHPNTLRSRLARLGIRRPPHERS